MSGGDGAEQGAETGTRRLVTESRVAIAVSLLALVVSGTGVLVSHKDRARDTRYSIRAQIRNISAHQRRFGLTSDAKPGQILEYRGVLHNWGNVDAKDVTIDVGEPNAAAGVIVKGSCTVSYPAQRPSPCGQKLDERRLYLSALKSDESLEVRFRFRTRLPPCDGYEASATFTARSADRTAIDDTSKAHVARRSDGLVCDTADARLMELIPLSYRDKCALRHYNKVVGDADAHIGCPDPADGIQDVDYYMYSTADRAKSAYIRRLKVVSRSDRRQCASDPDGEGYVTYRGRSRQEIRYVCWRYRPDGTSWIEILNRRYRLYIDAYRDDGDLRRLFAWTNDNTP